ncbi:MAG: hypothetical protein EAZ95_06305 [Bacteroidetes bacterium]|nr:MAG: hypothetical protein EAZ95_06305 [Bacteroidota bacterium]
MIDINSAFSLVNGLSSEAKTQTLQTLQAHQPLWGVHLTEAGEFATEIEVGERLKIALDVLQERCKWSM